MQKGDSPCWWDNGKENGNYYSILGLHRDNGKQNGNYCLRFRVLGVGLQNIVGGKCG